MDAQKRILEIKRNRGNSFSAQMAVPYELSQRFADITSDFNPLIKRGVVSGFYIDAVVASAFDDAMAGSRKHPTPVCISSKFRHYFPADTPAAFSFSPAPVTSAELCTANEGRPFSSVSISYGEPMQSHADPKSLGGMQGMMEHSFSKDELDEFGRMAGAIPGAKHLAPMLALSYLSGTAAMAVSTNYGHAEPGIFFKRAGPFFIWAYGLKTVKEEEPEGQNGLASISALAWECFEKGGVVYTSHSATFFRGAYELMPSENFRLYVDYSGLKALPSSGSKGAADIRGSIKGLAMLENGEKIFECTAGIYAKRKL